MRGRNHLAWIGPLLVFAGFVSYYLFFARFPVLRDFPWVNLPLIWAGAVLSVLGVARARRRGRGKIPAAVGLLFALLVTAFFHLYVFWLSYRLPDGAESAAVEAVAPDFTLQDQSGRPVSLSDLRGSNVVLVFYRGFW